MFYLSLLFCSCVVVFVVCCFVFVLFVQLLFPSLVNVNLGVRTTDFVTNMLMKVQHVAVSENSVHDSCVPVTVIWTWNFLHSLGKLDGICSMA